MQVITLKPKNNVGVTVSEWRKRTDQEDYLLTVKAKLCYSVIEVSYNSLATFLIIKIICLL